VIVMNKSIRIVLVMLLTLLSGNSLAGWEDSDFCWMESYGRGVGQIPKSPPNCPSGSFADPNGGCYTCPQYYLRSEYPVTSSKACVTLSRDYKEATRVADVKSCSLNSGHPDYNGLLCYQECRTNYIGVGPVCWFQCSGSTPVNCGMGCAISKEACEDNIMDQVFSVIGLAASVAGVSGVPTPVDQVLSATEELGNIASNIQATARCSAAGDRCGELIAGELVDRAVQVGENLPYGEAFTLANAILSGDTTNPMEIAGNIALAFDPTGVGAVLDAYVKPVCNGVPQYQQYSYTPRKVPNVWKTVNIGEVGKTSTTSAGTVRVKAHDIAVDKLGRAWVLAGYNDLGFPAVNKLYMQGSATAINPPDEKYMVRLDVDGGNVVWVVTSDGMLYYYKSGRWAKMSTPANYKVVDVQATYVVGTDKKIPLLVIFDDRQRRCRTKSKKLCLFYKRSPF
jgi:hypothetical protein